jgi:hypothetical protein
MKRLQKHGEHPFGSGGRPAPRNLLRGRMGRIVVNGQQSKDEISVLNNRGESRNT